MFAIRMAIVLVSDSIMFMYIVLIFSLVLESHALYFHIKETEKKCFIEEVPDQTMVISKIAKYFRIYGSGFVLKSFEIPMYFVFRDYDTGFC